MIDCEPGAGTLPYSSGIPGAGIQEILVRCMNKLIYEFMWHMNSEQKDQDLFLPKTELQCFAIPGLLKAQNSEVSGKVSRFYFRHDFLKSSNKTFSRMKGCRFQSVLASDLTA